jgi:glucan phosphoethanolaminetransferase (alkaline phosphatase superfamily)
MQHTIAAFVALSLIIGGVAAVLIAWRVQKRDTNEPKWRVTTSTIALLLITLSVFLFLTYRTYNAATGGEGNGNWITLPSIRTGKYASLLGLLASLIATRKMRWPLLAASCLIWFSQGVSL